MLPASFRAQHRCFASVQTSLHNVLAVAQTEALLSDTFEHHAKYSSFLCPLWCCINIGGTDFRIRSKGGS